MSSDLLNVLDLSPRSETDTPDPLEFEGNDPLAGVPLLLQLMCGCSSAHRDEGQIVDDITTVLRKDRKEVEACFRDESADRIGLVDALRYEALSQGSEPFHNLADRALVLFISDSPDRDLVDRLTKRLRPLLGQMARIGPPTPLRRANHIATARLTLLVALSGGDLETGLGRFWAPSSVGWTAKKLVQIAEVARGDLDDEIARTLYQREHADAKGRVHRDEDGELAMIPDYKNEPEPEPDEQIEDEDEDAEQNDDDQQVAGESSEPETIVVLPRLPLATGGDAKKLLEPFSQLVARALPLVATPDLAVVRASLVAELPHLAKVIDAVLTPIASFSSVRIPPTLFVGPPGCGKTTLAERLLQELDVPFTTYDAAGTSDAMVLGSSRKWSNGAPGLLLDLIVHNEIGNPGVIIDELEKAGGSDRNGDVRTSLLGLFEPRRARAFLDRFLDVPVDYSRVVWLATANSMDGIPMPLANRMRVLNCPAPGQEHLDLLAPQLMKAALTARGMDERWYQPLTQEELDALRRYWRGGSVRDLRRMVEGVLATRNIERSQN